MNRELPGLVGLATLIVLALLGIPAYWKEPSFPASAPIWWPYGRGLWRGVRRIVPTIVVGVLAGMTIGLIGGLIIPEGPKDSFGFVRPAAFVLLVLGIVFGSFFVALAIILWNAPKNLVPPQLRSEPGLLTRGDAHRSVR